MPRYTTRPRSFWVEDETYSEPVDHGLPTVCDHEPVDTGLLDKDGNSNWRSPDPMGFIHFD